SHEKAGPRRPGANVLRPTREIPAPRGSGWPTCRTAIDEVDDRLVGDTRRAGGAELHRARRGTRGKLTRCDHGAAAEVDDLHGVPARAGPASRGGLAAFGPAGEGGGRRGGGEDPRGGGLRPRGAPARW